MNQFFTMYRCNFGAFVDFAFRELNPGERMEDNWYIRLMAGLLQTTRFDTDGILPRRLIFNLPPGYLKTHICSISFPAWILGRDPSMSVLIVSETPDIALEIRERCAELMSSKRYRSLFPRPRIVRSARDLELNYGGRIRSSGIGHSLPSRASDLVVIDNPQSMHSLGRVDPAQFLEIGRTLKNPKTGMIVMVTRRLSENDLSSFLHGRPNWGSMVLPVIATSNIDWPGVNSNDYHQRKGEPLHESYEGWDKIEEQILDLGGEAFSWQYMQGAYRPPITGERIHYENGIGVGRLIGTFNATEVTLEDFAELKEDYLAKYDPMEVRQPVSPPS